MPLPRFYNPRANQRPFIAMKASTGRADCHKCHNKIEKDTAQMYISFRSAFGQKEHHYHLSCIFKEGKQFMTNNELGSLITIGDWSNVLGQ